MVMGVTIRPPQVEAFYEQVRAYQVDEWREAVTELLLLTVFPKPNQIRTALICSREARWKQGKKRERQEANQFFNGMMSRRDPRSAEAHAYGQFRLRLLREAFGSGRFQHIMATRLQKWLDCPGNREWSRQQSHQGCPEGTHNLETCLEIEIVRYEHAAQ